MFQVVKRTGIHQKPYELLVGKLKRKMNTFRFSVARVVIRAGIWLADHISYDSALDIFLEEFEVCGYCEDCDRVRW